MFNEISNLFFNKIDEIFKWSMFQVEISFLLLCKVVLGERECRGESARRGSSSQEGIDSEAEDQINFQNFIFVRIRNCSLKSVILIF